MTQAADHNANEEISGTVETIRFRNDDTGYTVCYVRIPGRDTGITVVGKAAAMWEGEELRATGSWTRHVRHGTQFQADEITCIAPTSIEGVRRFLASGMIKGIGKVNADRIVDHFGSDTLDVIDKQSARLEEVEGIGAKRRHMIKHSWNEQRAIRDIMIFLQAQGIGTAQAARIYRQYGSDAVAIVKANPYRLCQDIWGIGFKTADAIAASVGVEKESPVRARAGLRYILQTETEAGHCFCPEPELLLLAQEILDIPVEILAEALKNELREGALTKEQDRIYLTHLYQAECRTAARIQTLVASHASFRPIIAKKAVEWASSRMGINFAPAQVIALEMAFSNKVSIITGGPGVGKTTIIRALTEVFSARRLIMKLAAPTGRAAKRITESTNLEAQTLHRLLQYNPVVHGFEHDREHPIDAHVLICDEASMIDIRLMADLLDAVPDSATLVLVGDIDQLPSVGAGNVLRDIISAKTVPCTRLNTIFRQDESGLIVRNAHHVNHGEALEEPADGTQSDFFFIDTPDNEKALARAVDLVSNRIPRTFNLDPLLDIQILSPMRRGILGTENLNHMLQEKLTPGGNELQRFGRCYREGDRVMQIRNNYNKEVFNGDVGRILKVDNEEHQLIVEIDGRPILYELNELDELTHAYACTVHKSQGSEYPAVILLLSTQHFKLLQRNLLYTAITRGKQLVCIVGTHKAARIAIQNDQIRERRTGLSQKLSAIGA